MSEDEKNQQIGAAVSEYNAAKIELAHIGQKLVRVFAAYSDAIENGDKAVRELFELKVVNGKLKFSAGSTGVPSDLMNEADLTALIVERGQARQRVKKAQQMMASLGLTSIK